MEFGINKNLINVILKPELIKLYYKRRKYYKKLRIRGLSLGLGVSISKTEIGEFVSLGNNVSIFDSTIGYHSYVNSNSFINKTRIGKFCSIGANVNLGLGIHPTDLISTHPCFYSNNKEFKTFAKKNHFKEYKSINIGNDVWISSFVKIIGGVNIGNGAIIAAGAIVTKDVKPYEIVGGIPAKHIRFRFNNNLITILNDSKWWDKDEEWFEDNFELFQNNQKFIKYFK